MRIMSQVLLHLERQTAHASPHVGTASGDPYPDPRRNRDHRRRLRNIALTSSGRASPPTRITVPFVSMTTAADVTGCLAPSRSGLTTTGAKADADSDWTGLLLLLAPHPSALRARYHRHLSHRTVANHSANSIACTGATAQQTKIPSRRSPPERYPDFRVLDPRSHPSHRRSTPRSLCPEVVMMDQRIVTETHLPRDRFHQRHEVTPCHCRAKRDGVGQHQAE